MTQAVVDHVIDEAREPRNWLKVGARLGYASRGFVYVLVGSLALLAALGGSGAAPGERGAIATLLGKPFGMTILSLLAAGLAAFAIWRFCQSVLNADRHESDVEGLAVRFGMFVSSILHALLAVYAVSLIIGATTGGNDEEARIDRFSTWLLSKPMGAWIMGAIGAGVITGGLAQIIKGWRRGYRKWLKLDAAQMRWADAVCRIGLIARGIAFLIIGSLLIYSAARARPEEAGGLGEALSTLRRQPYGPWLLGAMALGLLAFAGYSMIEAAFRRVRAPRAEDITGA